MGSEHASKLGKNIGALGNTSHLPRKFLFVCFGLEMTYFGVL